MSFTAKVDLSGNGPTEPVEFPPIQTIQIVAAVPTHNQISEAEWWRHVYRNSNETFGKLRADSSPVANSIVKGSHG